MSHKFSLQKRLTEFRSKVQQHRIIKSGLLYYGAGWLASFFLALIYLDSALLILLFPLHVYFWFKFVGIIQDEIHPLTEILILLFIGFYFLDRLFISSSLPGDAVLPGVSFGIGISAVLQILFLGLLTLLFSVILVQNHSNKFVLLTFVFFGAISVFFFHRDAVFTTYFLQLILLIFLLGKTKWLEKLTQTECWIYWLVLFFTFSGFYAFDPLQPQTPQNFTQAFIWQKAPFYLFLIMRMYLLALLLKIPIILVYNHASLSRKLWISSLFQSSFPQFVQFFLLVSVFYFFISGWQAENFRTELTTQLDLVRNGQSTRGMTHFTHDLSTNTLTATIPGYLPIQVPTDLQGNRVVKGTRIGTSGERKVDYFIVFTDTDSLVGTLHLVKIDPALLELVTQDLSLIIGSKIKSYPFTTSNQVENFLYKINTNELKNVGPFYPFALLPYSKSNIQIFPFALYSNKSESAISLSLEEDTEPPPTFLGMQIEPQDLQSSLTAGRIFLPVFDANEDRDYFYAFDILIIPVLSLSLSPVLRLLVFLAIVYSLVNLLITRRMVKFGEKINDRIVQKFSQLKTGIREISSGNLDYKVELEGEDEFVELAERFNTMGDKLLKTIEESVEKERLEHELDMARQVQLGILPRELPEIPGYQIAASLKTATEVGGDFYDVLPLGKDKFLISIGDVTGKGSYAALYMAQCMSLIRFSHHFTQDPAEIAIRLNNYFSDPMVDKQLFVTAIIGILDSKKNHFKFVRAGHTHPIKLPGKPGSDIEEIIRPGLGIGLTTSERIFKDKLEVVDMRFGYEDAWIFYSDGLVEAAVEMDEEIEHYGDERLKKLLTKQHGKTANQILTKLEKDITKFYHGFSPIDDFTLLVVKREAKT